MTPWSHYSILLPQCKKISTFCRPRNFIRHFKSNGNDNYIIIALYVYSAAFRSPALAEEKNECFGERFMHHSRELLYFTVYSPIRFYMIQTWEEPSLFVDSGHAPVYLCVAQRQGISLKRKKGEEDKKREEARGIRHQIYVADE